MKRVERERVVIIGEATERGFQDAINDALDAHEGARLQEVDLAHLRAWIRFVDVELIPESIRDRYALRGIKPICGDCPYYQPPTDKRRRCGHCEMMTGVDPRDEVCDAYFRWLETGEVRWEGEKR